MTPGDHKKKKYQIHEMNLFSDFKEALQKIQHLPEVTVDKVIKQELKISKLKKEKINSGAASELKDQQIAQQSQEIALRDQRIAQKDQQIVHHDLTIKEQQLKIRKLEEKIKALEALSKTQERDDGQALKKSTTCNIF